MTTAAAAPLIRPQRQLCFEDLRKILSHRFPFLMLDKVVDFEPGKRIVAIKNVTANEIHFLGHFPNHAIMPGALIVEALAQALHVLDALSRDEETAAYGTLVKYLGSVTMTFMKPALPGDQLYLEVDIVKQMERGVMGTAVARVDGNPIAKGELVLIVKKGPPSE